MQLRLDLADNPVPVVALWELLEEERRRTAMALLAELIAHTTQGAREEPGGDE